MLRITANDERIITGALIDYSAGDYIATTKILPLGPVTEAGAIRCVFIATVVNDRLTEPDEVFYVVLDANPRTIIGSPDEASVAIFDDDCK